MDPYRWSNILMVTISPYQKEMFYYSGHKKKNKNYNKNYGYYMVNTQMVDTDTAIITIGIGIRPV